MHELLADATQMQETLVAHRRQLHQNPEVGFELPNTRAYITERLLALGYTPVEIGASITATVGGGPKTLLLRGDMDALPIAEQTGLAYAAQNGYMHACGHDFHTSMLLGAAALLKQREAELKGTVKLFFQAGEEILGGAKQAVELGLLDGVDAAAMLHIYSGFPLPSGMMSVSGAGPCCASSDRFSIDITGRGGHGAMPEASVNPIAIASAIYPALQEIVASGVPAAQQVVVTVGAIHAGDAPNVIPDTAVMEGTMRTFDEETRQALKQQLAETAAAIAISKGGRAQMTFPIGAPCLVSDKTVSDKALASLTALLGEGQALSLDTAMGGAYARTMGAEDFAYIAQKVPSVMLRLMAGSVQEGYTYPNHHPKVTYKEEVLPIGAAAYAKVALDFLAE